MTTDDDLIRRSDAVKALSPMLRDMISRGHACRIVAALPRADLSPSPEGVKELVEALRENARILGYLSNELQGIVDAGKLAALFNCADRARAALEKLEGGE